MIAKALISSEKMDWETPLDFFELLDREFGFTLDPCCNRDNAKCRKHFTVRENGLLQDWQGETVFCNPPYGRELTKWVEKCAIESRKPSTTVVMLIPSRTCTRYFHRFIYKKAKEIRFVKGRIRFVGGKSAAPFPSMVVIF